MVRARWSRAVDSVKCGSGKKDLQACLSSCSVKELAVKDPGRTLESQELSRMSGKGEDCFVLPKYNAPLIRKAFQLGKLLKFKNNVC